MDQLAIIAAKLALPLVCLPIGLRLVAVARRTRELPELAIGLAFLFLGTFAGVGLALYHLAEMRLAYPIANLCQFVGLAALAFFNWRAFRPDRVGATLFISAVLLVAIAGVSTVALELGHVPDSIVQRVAGTSIRSSVFAWAAIESFLEFAKMRRRARIGLSNPFLTNAFLLWGVGAAAAFGTYVVTVLGVLLAPEQAVPGALPLADLAEGALCLVAAAAIWLAFFPPAIYRRRFEGGAEAAPREAA